jgi:hypothetical protein
MAVIQFKQLVLLLLKQQVMLAIQLKNRTHQKLVSIYIELTLQLMNQVLSLVITIMF